MRIVSEEGWGVAGVRGEGAVGGGGAGEQDGLCPLQTKDLLGHRLPLSLDTGPCASSQPQLITLTVVTFYSEYYEMFLVIF